MESATLIGTRQATEMLTECLGRPIARHNLVYLSDKQLVRPTKVAGRLLWSPEQVRKAWRILEEQHANKR